MHGYETDEITLEELNSRILQLENDVAILKHLHNCRVDIMYERAAEEIEEIK